MTFIGCDNTYEESDFVLFGAPLTVQPLTAQAQDLPVQQSEMRVMG